MTTTDAPTTTPAVSPVTTAERTLSIVALVLAGVSLVFGYTFLVPAAAIVLGFIAHRREPAGRTMATWSIVLGFVAIFGWIIVAALGFAAFAPFLFFAAL